MNPEMQYPHFRNQSPEFIALADVVVAVNGSNIPLHSHVLAKSSKVFAQLFASFAESGNTGTPTKPAPVTDLFTGEDIATILLFMVLMYTPDQACLTAIFRDCSWGTGDSGDPPDATFCPNSEVTPELLQSVVRLADKLDAQPILNIVENLASQEWIKRDLLGWFLEGRKLGLQQVACESLGSLIRRLARRGPAPGYLSRQQIVEAADAAVELLQDPRWTQLDSQTNLLIFDALAAFQLAGAPTGGNLFQLRGGLLDKWKEPGDFVKSIILSAYRNDQNNNNNAGPVVQPAGLAMVAALNHQQALADWEQDWASGGETDSMGTSSSSSEEDDEDDDSENEDFM